MEGEKLKYKENEPIFFEDMNMELQEEMYADFTKDENKFTEALSALHESYCPAQINARDVEMSEI